MLLAPMPPLMFMGEEWGSTQPFPFFCDFQGDLAEAVREGRRQEFREAYANQQQLGNIPDPAGRGHVPGGEAQMVSPRRSHPMTAGSNMSNAC